MRLSEFGISKGCNNLSQKIYDIFVEIASKGIDILEWDIDGLVFDKDFINEQLYISNTASEKELKDSVRNIAIKMGNLSNLTIDGLGNTILYNNRCVQIALLKSKNVTIKNLTFDYINPTVAEFTVVNKGFGYIDVEINQDTLYAIKGGKLYFLADDKSRCVVQECDNAKGITRRVNELSYRGHNSFNGKWCKKLPDGKIRIYTLFPSFKVGNTYQCAWVRRDGTGLFMDECKNITLDNCRFKFMHGMGVLCQRTENITIKNTDFLPNKEHGRTTVAFADVMHFVNCKGVINVNNVKADGTRDDVINNHGIHLKITKVEGDKICVKYCHSQTYGFNCFYEGDEIEVVDSNTLLPITTAKIKSSTMLSQRIIQLELCEIAEKNSISVGAVVENATWTASLIVDNLETFNDPTRGILVTTRKPVVIKNCTFNKCYMPCIHISDDARSWYESGYCRDVLIENNVFNNCLDYAISIESENIGDKAVHKNIKIINNKIISENGKILTVKCAEGVIFDKNIIESKADIDVNLKNLLNSNINLQK